MSRTAARLRTLEAAGLLILAGLLVRGLAFHRLCALLGPTVEPVIQTGTVAADTPPPPPAPAKTGCEGAVAAAITAALRRLPWQPPCLTQAVAAALMLRRRHCRSRLVLGVRRTADGLTAHAWLLTDAGTICGGPAAHGFTPLAVISQGRE